VFVSGVLGFTKGVAMCVLRGALGKREGVALWGNNTDAFH
jgi:hypothetical protein